MYLTLLLQETTPLGLEKLTLIGALVAAVWALWRRLDAKDQQIKSFLDLGHEQAKATEDVAEALDELRHTIERERK